MIALSCYGAVQNPPIVRLFYDNHDEGVIVKPLVFLCCLQLSAHCCSLSFILLCRFIAVASSNNKSMLFILYIGSQLTPACLLIN